MYWIFVAISCLFILPSTYIVLRALFRDERDQDPDNSSEIDFLKNQLLQINNDIKSGGGGKDDKFNQTSVSRKLLTLQKNITNKTMVMNSPTKITVRISVLIIITCFFGTHLTYLVTNDNFFNFYKRDTLKDNDVSTVQKNLSQEKVEERIIREINDSGSDLIGSQSDNLEHLVNELKIALSNRPNDIRGQRLLVKNSARLGDFITSRKAQKKVLELLNEKASATDYARYAELCVIAASGFVSSEAASAINQAISLDANNSAANFYLSLLLLQKDKKTTAFKIWIKLLKDEQSSSKWIMMLIPQIKYVSLGLKIEEAEADKPNPEHLNSRVRFLQVLETMEKRLNRYNGPIEHWVSLVQSYKNLKFSKKAEINVEKIKSQFLLSNSQVKELENSLELK